MARIPRAALFQPLESIAGSLTPLFRKPHEYSLRTVTSVQQLLQVMREEEEIFDVIIVPSTLSDRSSAVTMCIQIKAEEELVATPVVVLSHIKDKPAISTFYGSGADVVIVAPFDAELLYLQIMALGRMTRSFHEELDANQRDKGLRQAMITALHFIEDALVILDTQPSVVFVNQAARDLFKLYETDKQDAAKGVYSKLEEVVKARTKELEGFNKDSNLPRSLRLGNIDLVRAHGQQFKADVRLLALSSASSETVAYCLAITDISAPRELSNALLQAERTQSLSLLFAAACMQLLGDNSLGEPGKGLSRIDAALQKQSAHCSLSAVMTSLLELIDIIVSASSVIRVSINQEVQIAMKPAHLFQLIGNLVLFSMRCSASQAQTMITLSTDPLSAFAILSIRSALPPNASTKTDERMLTSIRSQIIALAQAPHAREEKKAALGISGAQEIAALYRVHIAQKSLSDLEVELTVELPLA